MTNPIWNQASWKQRNPVAKTTISSHVVNDGVAYEAALADSCCKQCGHHVHDIDCPARLGGRSSAAYPQVDKAQAKAPKTSKTLCEKCLSLEAYQGSRYCYACAEQTMRDQIAYAYKLAEEERHRQAEFARHQDALKLYQAKLREVEQRNAMAQHMQQLYGEYGHVNISQSTNAIWNRQQHYATVNHVQQTYGGIANALSSLQAQACPGVKEAEARMRNSTDFVWNEEKQAFYPVMWGQNRQKFDTGR